MALETGTKLALATISPSAPTSSRRARAASSNCSPISTATTARVGAATAGLPLYDTLNCPPIDQTNSCTYDIFDKSYALFAYHAPLANGPELHHPQPLRQYQQSSSIPSGRRAVASPASGARWTWRPRITAFTDRLPPLPAPPPRCRRYTNGAIYSITSGINAIALFSVLQPIYGLYVTNGGPAGSLGLPTTQEIVLSNGDHRQTFEGGVAAIHARRRRPGDPAAGFQRAISGVPLGSTLNLTLGQT